MQPLALSVERLPLSGCKPIRSRRLLMQNGLAIVLNGPCRRWSTHIRYGGVLLQKSQVSWGSLRMLCMEPTVGGLWEIWRAFLPSQLHSQARVAPRAVERLVQTLKSRGSRAGAPPNAREKLACTWRAFSLPADGRARAAASNQQHRKQAFCISDAEFHFTTCFFRNALFSHLAHFRHQ